MTAPAKCEVHDGTHNSRSREGRGTTYNIKACTCASWVFELGMALIIQAIIGEFSFSTRTMRFLETLADCEGL